MDNISYAKAAQAFSASKSALTQIQTLTTLLNTAIQNITVLTNEINDLKTKYSNVKTQLDSTTPFDPSVLNSYAKKVQTIDTDTVYIDSNTNKSYKFYVTNNIIALEEVIPQSN